MSLPPLAAIGVGLFFIFIGLLIVMAIFKVFYFRAEQDVALIKNRLGDRPKVFFTDNTWILPIIHKKELVRLSLIELKVDRRGKDGLICADNMRVDISLAFYLKVNETPEDVLRVARSLGADRASDRNAVRELFNARFFEALKTVCRQIDFVKLFEDPQGFRDNIIREIGNDLYGYELVDVVIDFIEQTPKSSLDPQIALEAEGVAARNAAANA